MILKTLPCSDLALLMRPRLSLSLIVLVGVSLVAFISLSFQRRLEGCDKGTCRGIFMYPAYARVYAFDESHTKYASKYSLYLYREQGKDPIPDQNNVKLTGTPVLFIPGNAGSYRQVRSIAAESAKLFYDDKHGTQALDFFAAEFNGDFTAFHGRTMMDQSEYLNDAIRFILGLYEDNEDAPHSIVLLAHSMGGIVSRVMMTLPNYVEGSVNTIVTLATPHAAAPATFDGDLLQIVRATDDYWRRGFVETDGEPYERLHELAIASITGGILDLTLPADYTTLMGLVPESNGITAATSGIPGVWTPIDHLAIVWCDQLRHVVAKILLKVVSKSTTADKMGVFKQNLLGIQPPPTKPVGLKIDMADLQEGVRGVTLLQHNSRRLHAFPLQPKMQFSLLGSSPLAPCGDSGVSVMLCKEASQTYDDEFDFTSAKTSKFTHLECRNTDTLAQMVPNPALDASESSFGAQSPPYYSMELSSELDGYTTVVVVDENLPKEALFIMDLSNTADSNVILGDTHLWTLFTRGLHLTLPSSSPLQVNIQVPSARSSLLTYSVDIRYDSEKSQFPPLLMQHIADETKWHVKINNKTSEAVSVNGVSPFCPFSRNDHLTLKLVAKSDSIVEIYMSVDWFASLRNLVLAYRLSLVGLPVFVCCFLLILQTQSYIKDGRFPSVGDTLLSFCSPRIFGPLLLAFSLLSSAVSSPLAKKILPYIDPIPVANASLRQQIAPESDLDEYFLGIGEDSLWFYGPLSFVLATALVALLYLLEAGIIDGACYVAKKLHVDPQSGDPKRRVIVSVILILLVTFYLPYQFAYAVCFIVQCLVVVRANLHKESANFRNFNTVLLLIMTWILPINLPVLVVWIHNFSIHWSTPFSSQHNLSAILPTLLLVQLNDAGYMFSQQAASISFSRLIPAYFALYAVLFGTRHLFWLHYLFNILCSWYFVTLVDDYRCQRLTTDVDAGKLH